MATSEIPVSGPNRSKEEDLTCYISLWLTLFEDATITAIKGFVDLMTRDFWTRIWIIQEVVLPERVFVMCGNFFTTWDRLNRISRIIGGKGIIERCPTANVDQGLFQCINSLRMLYQRRQHDFSLSDLVPSHARSLATHPHDNVSALMGMTANDPVQERLVLDYDAPVEQLYLEYFREACNFSDNLFLLCLGGINFRSTLKMPSFVPDWTCAGRCPAYPMLVKYWLGNPGLHPADLHFHKDVLVDWGAAGSAKPNIEYLHDGSVLVVKGIEVDLIQTVGAAATDIGKDESIQNLRETLADWALIVLKIFRLEKVLVENKDTPVTVRDVADRWCEIVSCKILTEEAALDLKQVSESLSEIEQKDKKQDNIPPVGNYTYPLTGENILESYVRTLVTDRVSALETAGDKFGDQFWNHEVQPSDAAAGELGPYFAKLTRARAIQRGRRFFVTKSRLIGLCPGETQAGDVICVLYGCPIPMVVRPQSDGYVLVGECYVHGLMKGAVVERLQEAQKDGTTARLWKKSLVVDEREFELH